MNDDTTTCSICKVSEPQIEFVWHQHIYLKPAESWTKIVINNFATYICPNHTPVEKIQVFIQAMERDENERL